MFCGLLLLAVLVLCFLAMSLGQPAADLVMPSAFAALLLSAAPQFLSYVLLVRALDAGQPVPIDVSISAPFASLVVSVQM